MMDIVGERIQEQLGRIEIAHNVRILVAVESGSRAWGFASTDSDYDVRFLFVRPLLDYLRIRPMRDVIELPIEDDLDINGWDLVKALNLFRASNPALLEWLRSPIVYREETDLAERLRSLAETHASPRRMGYHYLSMAKGQFRGYIEGQQEISLKKYLYVLRPLFCLLWLERHGTPPPTALTDVLSGLTLPDEVAESLASLLERKKAAMELGQSEPVPALDAFCRREIVRLEQSIPQLPDPTIDAGLLDTVFHRVLGLNDS
jgi:predicted nucleotidyltransferase